MNERNNAVPITGFVITLVAAILFSTKAIIIKLAFAATNADAVTMITLRMIFALPFYLVAAFFISNNSGNTRMTKQQWLVVLGLGLIGYYISSLCDFIGLQYVSAGLERLILFLYPTFAVLINAKVYKQKISRIQMIALALTYAGIAIAFFGELQVDSNNPNFLWGSFMIFLCAVTFSIYMVGSGRIIPVIGSAKFTAYAMLAATVGVFVHFAVTSNIRVLSGGNGLWFYGLLLAVVATVFPSFMMSNGMKRIGSNNVAIINSIGPVSTILQAHFILGERMFAEQVTGTALVMVGVMLIGWKSRTMEVKI
jgi:drug/metabolite transporter (DMT)-like permease